MLTPPIARYCRARLGGHGAAHLHAARPRADDVARDVCFAVLRALPGHRDKGGSFLFLVRAIAANTVADAARRGSGERPHPTPEPPEPTGEHGHPEHASGPGHRLAGLLDRLPAVQREILVLRVAVGLSADDTAEALGLLPAHVRTTQHRALARLRGAVDGAGG